MALKTILDTVEGVDDAVKALYAEKDGKFVLDVEGIDAHPEVASLKSAYERVKADKVKAAADLEAARTQLAEATKDKPDLAALTAQLTSAKDELAAERARTADFQTKLTGVTRDRALSDALAGAGVKDPVFQKAASALFAGQVKMDGETAVVETSMGPRLLTDHIKAWAAGEGKSFVAPASGGGANGNDGAGGGKTMKRADFDALPADQKPKIIAEGTRLTD